MVKDHTFALFNFGTHPSGIRQVLGRYLASIQANLGGYLGGYQPGSGSHHLKEKYIAYP